MKHAFLFIGGLMLLTIACNNHTPVTNSDTGIKMNPDSNMAINKIERNKATALASMKAFNEHNVDEVLSSGTGDLVDYGDGSGMVVKGKDSIKAMMQAYLKAFPDAKGEDLTAIAEENKVAVFGKWSGTFKNEFMGMKPTGKTYKYNDADIFTFNDAGQITEHRSLQSANYMWMQLGVKMK